MGKFLKNWSFFLAVMVIGAGLTLYATTQRTYPSEDNTIFGIAMLCFPLFFCLVSRQKLAIRLQRVLASVVSWLVFYHLYVEYQNRLYIRRPPLKGCDGPCYGWYTFENPPIYGILLIVAGISTLVSLLIYAVMSGVGPRN